MIVFVGEQPSESLAKAGNWRGFSSAYSAVRLVKLCGLASVSHLHERAWLLNLMPRERPTRGPKRKARGQWLIQMARLRAAVLAPKLMGRRVVILGVRVARAFGLLRLPLLEWHSVVAYGSRFEVARCPHLSGKNRWWNEPDNMDRARRFLTAAVWGAP